MWRREPVEATRVLVRGVWWTSCRRYRGRRGRDGGNGLRRVDARALELSNRISEEGKRNAREDAVWRTCNRRVAVAPSVPPVWTSRAESDFDRPRVDAFERIEDADDGQSSFTFIGLV